MPRQGLPPLEARIRPSSGSQLLFTFHRNRFFGGAPYQAGPSHPLQTRNSHIYERAHSRGHTQEGAKSVSAVVQKLSFWNTRPLGTESPSDPPACLLLAADVDRWAP